MGYVGNQTTNSFSSFDKQDLTGVTGSPAKRGFTLSHAVANAQEIEVFVNNVRQEPGEAYTISGTALTMTGDVETTDDFYVIYQGKALQTTVPPDGSVSGAKLASGAAATNLGSSVNLATIKDSGGSVTAMTIDSSGRVSTPVKPFAFVGFPGTDSYVAKTANTIVDFSYAFVNDGNHYDTSTYKFTCPVAGLYRVEVSTLSESVDQVQAWLFHRETGGSATTLGRIYTQNRATHGSMTIKCSANDKLYLTQNNNISYYQTITVPYNWATYTFLG
tara:strand:+ start:134 stop:958 length:825 start_codon:yes stop_codon:yes gene_type:complete